MAAALVQHVHHTPSLAAYVSTERKRAFCAAHSLAEVYATLTRLPGNQRLSCEQAWFFLEETAQRITAVPLEVEEYRRTLAEAATENLAGGIIYDALLARCALKAKADTILSWNVEHFRRLGPEVARRVRTP